MVPSKWRCFRILWGKQMWMCFSDSDSQSVNLYISVVPQCENEKNYWKWFRTGATNRDITNVAVNRLNNLTNLSGLPFKLMQHFRWKSAAWWLYKQPFIFTSNDYPLFCLWSFWHLDLYRKMEYSVNTHLWRFSDWFSNLMVYGSYFAVNIPHLANCQQRCLP